MEMRPGKFGRNEAVIKIVEKGDKFPRGYVTIKGKLYKVTVSHGQKEDKNGNPIRFWVNLMEMDNSPRSNSSRRY